MARPLRMEYPGAVYHVTSRGDRRDVIFEENKDRRAFLSIFGDVMQRFGWLCHAYCLMDNHYHLLIETPDPNLSRGMRQLNGVYTQRFNASHDRVGHLFQGRYKGIVIEKDSHLLEVCRYVVLNPVRAAMVAHPRHWRWSSYRATAESNAPPAFLATDWVLRQFGRRRADAQRAYRAFVREGVGATTPWEDIVGGLVLGSDTFAAQCHARLNGEEDLRDIPREQRYLGHPPLDDLFKRIDRQNKSARNKAIATAYVTHGYTMSAIADFLQIHYMTVSRAVKTYEQML